MNSSPSLLAPHFFYLFQAWANWGHLRAFELLKKYIAWKPGETILELGCGAGNLATHFCNEKMSYIGLDISSQRIAYAKKRFPQGIFLVADARQPLISPTTRPHYAFCHGLLHHLSPEDTLAVLKQTAQTIGPEGRFVAIEDVLPESSTKAPLNHLFAKLDDGKYIRTQKGWRNLFGASLIETELIVLSPRWYVPKLACHINLHNFISPS